MRKTTRLGALLCASAAGAALAVMALPANAQGIPQPNFTQAVSNTRLLNAINEPQNWLTSLGQVEGWRYSRLDQVNRDNVSDLQMVWAMSLGGAPDVTGNNGANIMAPPMVDNGMMYAVSSWQRVFKIDVRNPNAGDLLWISDPQIEHEGNGSATRGIALYGRNIYNPLQDGRFVATDRDTGEIVWDVQMAVATEYGGRERFNAAPLCIEDHCMVANATGDGGTRGWLAGVDPVDGTELWRTYVIPAPGEPGAETWQDEAQTAWTRGGGGMWTTGTYDPVNRHVLWGTGNPVPTYDPEFRPGDNLFTDSTIAFNVDTGAMEWYFQLLPNDSWDYDENGVNMVYDIEMDGEMRHVVGHFGRNGFYYNWDAATGEFLNANQWVNELNWTAGIDEKTGLPVEYDPALGVQQYIPETRALRGDDATTSCPTWHGGAAHQPPAYNPVKHIAYMAATEGCYTETGGQLVDNPPPAGQATLQGREWTSDLYYGAITAVDVTTNTLVAKFNNPTEIRSGVLATAGGLIFVTRTEGDIIALNDETLQVMWSFNVGTPLKAPPITYAVDGRQYIAFQSSGLHVHPVRYTDLQHSEYLFVFALPQ